MDPPLRLPLNVDQASSQYLPPTVPFGLKGRAGHIVNILDENDVAFCGLEIFQKSPVSPRPEEKLALPSTGQPVPLLPGHSVRRWILNAETQMESNAIPTMKLVRTPFPQSSEFRKELLGNGEMGFPHPRFDRFPQMLFESGEGPPPHTMKWNQCLRSVGQREKITTQEDGQTGV